MNFKCEDTLSGRGRTDNVIFKSRYASSHSLLLSYSPAAPGAHASQAHDCVLKVRGGGNGQGNKGLKGRWSQWRGKYGVQGAVEVAGEAVEGAVEGRLLEDPIIY